jgi:Terminase large subunit, T4likevirus-type, N-terminal/Terminase RNaseH-like domain
MVEFDTEFGKIELPKNEAMMLDYRGYRGDTTLKKAGVKIEWTRELMAEYKKCAKDPIYFIETYMKVVHPDHGLVEFKLRVYQRRLIKNIHENRRCITTMARQSGKSTAVIGYLLWYILFNKYKLVMLLANKAPTAREILGKAQLAFSMLPKFLQQGVVEWNKGSIVLENGCRALAEATSSDSIRGFTSNVLILDEAAHIEQWEEFSKSTLPTIAAGLTTKVVMISTPNGMNHFWSYWNLAQYWKTPTAELPPGIKWNKYIPLLVTWREVPGREEQWYEETMAEMNFDQDKFNQEYECQFLGSSGTLIAGWKLKELATDVRIPLIPVQKDSGLYEYIRPIKDHIYTMTADVSEGKALDYSTFHVVDITDTPYTQACVFRSNLTTPGDFAEIMFRTAKAYNNAYILIEYENLGPVVAWEIFGEFDYENLVCTESAGRTGKRITFRSGKAVDQGIKMTPIVRQQGCSLLKLLVEQNQLKLSDYHTIQELSRFSKKNNKFQAEEGAHDDLVMALVVFGWMSNQQFFKDLTNVDILKKLRDKSQDDIEEDLIPFGFIDRGEVGPTTAELYRWPDLWRGTQRPINNYSPYKFGLTPEADEIEWLPNF